MFFVFLSTPDLNKIQEICDRGVSEDPFLIVYCPDKAFDDSLAALILACRIFL